MCNSAAGAEPIAARASSAVTARGSAPRGPSARGDTLPAEATARCGTLLPRITVGLPGHGPGTVGALDRIDVDATESDAYLAELSGGVDARIVGRPVTAFRTISVAGATQSGAGVMLIESVPHYRPAMAVYPLDLRECPCPARSAKSLARHHAVAFHQQVGQAAEDR